MTAIVDPPTYAAAPPNGVAASEPTAPDTQSTPKTFHQFTL